MHCAISLVRCWQFWLLFCHYFHAESQNDAVCQELLKWFLPDSDGDT